MTSLPHTRGEWHGGGGFSKLSIISIDSIKVFLRVEGRFGDLEARNDRASMAEAPPRGQRNRGGYYWFEISDFRFQIWPLPVLLADLGQRGRNRVERPTGPRRHEDRSTAEPKTQYPQTTQITQIRIRRSLRIISIYCSAEKKSCSK